MVDEGAPDRPPLVPLHSQDTLNPLKLQSMRSLSTKVLLDSLCPPKRECLKTRRDGTILDGRHRIFVLRERGVEVDALPREIVAKEQP